MPRRAQPVPPIFEPEVAAEAIVFAAAARRRELWVGWPTIRAILANKVVPGLLDRVLAGIGYRGQMADEAVSPDQPDNLFAPLAGDHGARGRFGGRAQGSSLALWAAMHRDAIVWAALGLGGLVALASRTRMTAREIEAASGPAVRFLRRTQDAASRRRRS